MQVIDIAPALASRRVFLRLRTDDELFRTLRVNEDGNAIEWEDGAELTAIWLERLAPSSLENTEFRAAMEELGYSLDGMAARLGLSRRLIAEIRPLIALIPEPSALLLFGMAAMVMVRYRRA